MDGEDIITAIREALNRKGTNPSRFAKENGFSINAVRYILEGRPPSSRRLAEICKALGLEFYVGLPRMEAGTRLDVGQIATQLERLAGEARRIAAAESKFPIEIDHSDRYVSAPRYEVLAAAGSGAAIEDEVIKGYLGFNRSWLREEGLMAGKLAVIEVQGDSMEPTLRERDVVLLDMRTQALRDGDVYTLRRDSDLLVKRLRRQGPNWLIVSDNIAYPVEPLDESVSVVGRVVWLGRTLPRSA